MARRNGIRVSVENHGAFSLLSLPLLAALLRFLLSFTRRRVAAWDWRSLPTPHLFYFRRLDERQGFSGYDAVDATDTQCPVKTRGSRFRRAHRLWTTADARVVSSPAFVTPTSRSLVLARLIRATWETRPEKRLPWELSMSRSTRSRDPIARNHCAARTLVAGWLLAALPPNFSKRHTNTSVQSDYASSFVSCIFVCRIRGMASSITRAGTTLSLRL